MPHNTYLDWVIQNTPTKWWHDSAEQEELVRGLERGAVGVTTNPFLSNLAIRKNRPLWEREIAEAISCSGTAEQKAEAYTRIVVMNAARQFLPEYERSRGVNGYVCAQVNPLRAGERAPMAAMARRFSAWSPNIAVKLPCTSAGLDVLEDCIAEGITVTSTVSFTVPQAVAIGDRASRGAERARAAGIRPGRCFAVIMIGRLDDYLREVAADNQAAVSESDIRQAGVAATKRAYSIYRERGYDAVLLVAALRGANHLTEFAGAELIMSIAPSFQEVFVKQDFPREPRIHCPVPADVIKRLQTLPEFARAFEPDGMKPAEFVTYGATQRTLSQFCEVGWKLLENFQ